MALDFSVRIPKRNSMFGNINFIFPNSLDSGNKVSISCSLFIKAQSRYPVVFRDFNSNYPYAVPYSFSTAGYIFSLPILVLS